MSYHVVVDQPGRGPRFLGSFKTQEEADAMRVRLILDHPAWGRFVRIIIGTARPARLPSST